MMIRESAARIIVIVVLALLSGYAAWGCYDMGNQDGEKEMTDPGMKP